MTPHGKDSTKEGTYILGGVEDIFTQLDDSQVVVGTIKGSRYIGPVKSVCFLYFIFYFIVLFTEYKFYRMQSFGINN